MGSTFMQVMVDRMHDVDFGSDIFQSIFAQDIGLTLDIIVVGAISNNPYSPLERRLNSAKYAPKHCSNRSTLLSASGSRCSSRLT